MQPTIDKYYLVHNLHRGMPNQKHETREQATQEAARLAAKHPGEMICVLEVVCGFKTPDPAVLEYVAV